MEKQYNAMVAWVEKVQTHSYISAPSAKLVKMFSGAW